MKIVIELREDTYEAIRRIGSGSPLYIDRAILEGVILPKGHGRLIDADDLEMYGSWQMQIIPEGNGKYVETKIYTQRAVDAMQTIIPADKGGRE